MSRSIYSLAGRVGGHARAAMYNGIEVTQRARDAFAASFHEGHACRVCPRVELPADLLPGERGRRAESLRRAHFSRVALASVRARADKKRTAAVRKAATAQEVDGVQDHRSRRAES